MKEYRRSSARGCSGSLSYQSLPSLRGYYHCSKSSVIAVGFLPLLLVVSSTCRVRVAHFQRGSSRTASCCQLYSIYLISFAVYWVLLFRSYPRCHHFRMMALLLHHLHFQGSFAELSAARQPTGATAFSHSLKSLKYYLKDSRLRKAWKNIVW